MKSINPEMIVLAREIRGISQSELADLIQLTQGMLSKIEKGLNKLILNEAKLHADLEANWAVVAEAIQTVLRRENYPQPYEALKELTRGKKVVDKKSIHQFIAKLKVSAAIKKELKSITPQNYTGV